MKKAASALIFALLLVLGILVLRDPAPAVDTPPASTGTVTPDATDIPAPDQPTETSPAETGALPAEPDTTASPPAEGSEPEAEEALFLPAEGVSFPDFLLHFDFDRADWLDVNAFRDYAICLMGEEECAALKAILAPTTWTVATDLPAIGLEPAYILYDHAGNSLTVNHWESEYCLIIACEQGEDGDPHRYFAPNSVLENFENYMASLDPLPGTVSSSEEMYYHLFLDDAGIEALITLASEDGSLSDEQLYTYATFRIPAFGFENPQATYAYDTVTLLHFGRTVANPVGRTFGFGFDCHLVLQEESMDENGVITARFKCYSIPDYYERDGVLPDLQMRHVKEHLLTGNDAGFPEPTTVEIVFELLFDIPTQTSYVFYHSVKVLPRQIEDASAAYQAVLSGELNFISEAGSVMPLSDYAASLYAPEYADAASFTAFTRCDLDGDGAPEVILSDATDDNAFAGTTVLHWQDGTVYAHHFPYRGFNNLKADGTFHFSSGASDCGIASLSFEESTCTVEKISYCDSELDVSGEFVVHYYVNRKEAAEGEFSAAMAELAGKEEPVWYEFTPENIAAAFAN